MPAEQRRAELVASTLELIRQHGLSVSTRQIAEAAGVAEGTIFRVFETKDELVQAAIQSVFDPSPMVDAIERIDPRLPLEQRLVALVGLMQRQFLEVFSFMRVAGLVQPPEHHRHGTHEQKWATLFRDRIVELIGADAARLRCTPEGLARVLRLLTFSGSHPGIAHRRLLTPEQIVDVVLHGLLTGDADPAPPWPEESAPGTEHDEGWRD